MNAFNPPFIPGSHSKLQESFPVDVRTPAEPWAYGAQFPLKTRGLKGPLWVCVEATIRSGPVGIGILKQDGSDFLARTAVQTPGEIMVTLRVPISESIGDLVIQSWDKDVSGDLRIESITVIEPNTPSATPLPDPITLSSMVCRYDHWSTDWFKNWTEKFGHPPNPTGAGIHRKLWEFCAIGRALEERGMLSAGRNGLCFAAGREFLPSVFAAAGCNILATDLATQGHWENQHAASRADLFYEGIVNREDFDKRVSFRHVDMRKISGIETDKYDFLWSACAFEHLGSLDAGLDFVINAMKFLRRGGIAAHTTEFNLSSNDETIKSGDNVIYRRRDIEELGHRLRKSRCALEPVDFEGGHHPFDLDYVDTRLAAEDKPHVKIELGGFVSTSILLIVRKV